MGSDPMALRWPGTAGRWNQPDWSGVDFKNMATKAKNTPLEDLRRGNQAWATAATRPYGETSFYYSDAENGATGFGAADGSAGVFTVPRGSWTCSAWMKVAQQADPQWTAALMSDASNRNILSFAHASETVPGTIGPGNMEDMFQDGEGEVSSVPPVLSPSLAEIYQWKEMTTVYTTEESVNSTELASGVAFCFDDSGPSNIHDAIPNRYSINWDDNSGGTISDGGDDMYDGGNRITTSNNGGNLAPYRDNMDPFETDYFGPNSVIKMDIMPSMMILMSENTGESDMIFYISGNLGADGGGQHTAGEHEGEGERSYLKGFWTMTCNGNGNDPSINHLFIFDQVLSPNAVHTYNANTDSDDDQVAGIAPGSLFFYLLYSSRRGDQHCMDQASHRAIFDAVVESMFPIEECTAPPGNLKYYIDGELAFEGDYTIRANSYGIRYFFNSGYSGSNTEQVWLQLHVAICRHYVALTGLTWCRCTEVRRALLGHLLLRHFLECRPDRTQPPRPQAEVRKCLSAVPSSHSHCASRSTLSASGHDGAPPHPQVLEHGTNGVAGGIPLAALRPISALGPVRRAQVVELRQSSAH